MITQIDPLDDGISFVKYVDHSGSDEQIAEHAGISYAKKPKTELGEFLGKLLKKGHETPFEHTQIRFLIKAPIFVARQWMRHRVGWSYSEKSMRYVDATDSCEFYTHEYEYLASDEIAEHWASAIELYEDLVRLGCEKQYARQVLPVATYTEFYATCNLRSFFHFYRLRASEHAQPETRKYAEALMNIVKQHFPLSCAGVECA